MSDNVGKSAFSIEEQSNHARDGKVDEIRLPDNIRTMVDTIDQPTDEKAVSENFVLDAEKYMFGLNSAQQLNPTKAFELANKAFEMKHPRAAAFVANLYRTGEGVARDLQQAKRFAHHGFKVDGDPIAMLEYIWARKAQQHEEEIATTSNALISSSTKGTSSPSDILSDTDEDPTPDEIKEKVSLLLSRAEKLHEIDAIAMHYISMCYGHGHGLPLDPTLEIMWTQRAAEAGNALSQFNLAEYYHHSANAEHNSTEVEYWYRRAAQQGLHEAMFELALCLESKANTLKHVWKHSNKHRQHHHHQRHRHRKNGTATRETQRQRPQPSPSSHEMVQVVNDKGDDKQSIRQHNNGSKLVYDDNGQKEESDKGKHKDEPTTITTTTSTTIANNQSEPCEVCSYEMVGNEAMEWFRRAANRGNADAACELAYSYANGRWTPKDDNKAFEWYLFAANLSHPVATYNCAIALEHGNGIAADEKRSRQMLEKAARDLDCADAQCYLSQLLLEESYDRESGIKNPDLFRTAMQLLERSAEHGHLGAQMSVLCAKDHNKHCQPRTTTTWAKVQQRFLSGETFSCAAWSLLPPRLDCGDRQKLIASGRYGSVYRVLLPTRAFVVMKYQNNQTAWPELCLADLVAQLAVGYHPNVIQLLGLACTDLPHLIRGQARFVYEWAPYGSLNQLFDTDNSVELKTKPEAVINTLVQFFNKPDYLLSLLQDVARGLLHLHSKGMVHRDIALRNIVVDETCRAKIIDLGLARFIDEKEGYYIHRAVHITLSEDQKQMISTLAERGFIVWNGRQSGDVRTWNALDKRRETSVPSESSSNSSTTDWEKKAVTIVLDHSHPIHEFVLSRSAAGAEQPMVDTNGIHGASCIIQHFGDLRAFVIEYTEHGLVQQLLDHDKQTLKPWQVLRIATDISAILAELAHRGWYHGHVTPRHIILGDDMQAKLLGCEFYCLRKQQLGTDPNDLVLFGHTMTQLLMRVVDDVDDKDNNNNDTTTTRATSITTTSATTTASTRKWSSQWRKCTEAIIAECLENNSGVSPQTIASSVYHQLLELFRSVAPMDVLQRFQDRQPFVPLLLIPKLVWRQSDDLVAFGCVIEALWELAGNVGRIGYHSNNENGINENSNDNNEARIDCKANSTRNLEGEIEDIQDDNVKAIEFAYEYCKQATVDTNANARRLCEILQVRLDLPLLESPILRDKILPTWKSIEDELLK